MRVIPTSHAIDESVDLAHEIYNGVFSKTPEKTQRVVSRVNDDPGGSILVRKQLSQDIEKKAGQISAKLFIPVAELSLH